MPRLAGFVHPQFLVETAWLAANLGLPELRVIDCTVHIGFDPHAEPCYTVASGQADFERTHIPGAQFVDVVTELSDAANPVPLMAPSAAEFSAVMSRLGVSNKSRVVLYSGQNAYWAAWVWWLLRVFGFDNAALLDGGWQKWRREGRPSETGPAKPRRPARFVVRQRDLMATRAEVLAAIGDAGVCTINALPADVHNFTSGVHYGRPGHITGSVNVPSADVVDPVTNEFRPPAELRQRFEAEGAFDKRVITYCGAGIAAAADAMALVMLGHLDVKVYDGSLCEWAADPSLPMEAPLVPVSPNQAIVTFESRRLTAELREALDQQTAMTEVLQVINSSAGDLAPVFDAMLEKAARLCETAFGIFHSFDGETFHTIALRGAPPALVDFYRQPLKPAPGTFAEQVVQGATIVSADDLSQHEMYRIGRGTKAVVDLAGGRSFVGIALRKDDKLLGAFWMYRREVRPFSEKEIALLQNFAAQAVIAMENARLLTETREALEQQTATAEVLGVINSSPGDLAPVFDAILEKAHSLCGIAFGSLQLYVDGKVHAVAARAIAEDLAELLREPMAPRPGSALSRLLAGERFVQNADILEVAKRVPDDPRIQLSAARGLRTGLWVPLRKEGDFLGYISAFRDQVRPFSEREISVLESFAAQAVIAIENARLLGELRQRTEEVAELNRGLEARVAEQVDELGRVGRLKRFLAPQLAELIVSQGDEKILESHRREIVVVFCDLRGYTAFTETAEPEEVLEFLREYHGALGPLVAQFEGTLDQFSGDGIMVFFNDPVPIPDSAERAVKMSIAMREAASALISGWRRLGRDLGFGAGIAQGYATLGQIGFSERSGYTAIGTVCNVAARLCAEAKDGQILLSQRVAARLNDTVTLEEIGTLTLKGLTQPVIAFNVPLAANHPALRVIEGGPPSA